MLLEEKSYFSHIVSAQSALLYSMIMTICYVAGEGNNCTMIEFPFFLSVVKDVITGVI